MAARIRDGGMSAREALEICLEAVGRWNPLLNAIVTLDVEGAKRAAAECDERQARGAVLGPAHGLPVVHKDLFAVAGMRTTYGSPLYLDHIPMEDALIVSRWRAGGAVTLGKSNTSEFGAGAQTFNKVFGATRNPYDPTLTCGGSSGGSAVALACGMAALADGTDSGGSLRIPAAFCGVVGMRPTVGRVPEPAERFGWSGMSTPGVMGRDVGDLELALSVVAGHDERAPLSFGVGRRRDGRRVAWYRNAGGLPIEARVRETVEVGRRILDGLGYSVEEAEPDLEDAAAAFRTLRLWQTAAVHGEACERNPTGYKEVMRQEVEAGLRLTGSQVADAEAARTRAWRTMARFFERFDYFLLPATQVMPFAVEEPYLREIEGRKLASYIDWFEITWRISGTGCPALSLPIGMVGGLPVGLQIVGRPWDDEGVIALAREIEMARGDFVGPNLREAALTKVKEIESK
jgi:amidase